MIELVFTLDYEIYGNGTGSLRELVYEPAERLKSVFLKHGARFVAFVEAAELEMIELAEADEAIASVKAQIRTLESEGFELGLHLHPQWYNGRYHGGSWELDYGEYNLCVLPPERIAEIVDRSITYLRRVLGRPEFSPLAFRAGNWLFQPTAAAARVLAERGLRIDSSVFKGGIRRQHGLDYRSARRNGYQWAFSDDVTAPDPRGRMTEFPIFTTMVPAWRMLSLERLGKEAKGSAGSPRKDRIYRLLDSVRFRHPLKLDFCRMGLTDLERMLKKERDRDREDPGLFRPLVAIGHTKELTGLETIDRFLSRLEDLAIPVATFRDWAVRSEVSNPVRGTPASDGRPGPVRDRVGRR